MYKNFVRFALRKLGIMILTVFLISFFVFFIITLPQDNAHKEVGNGHSDEADRGKQVVPYGILVHGAVNSNGNRNQVGEYHRDQREHHRGDDIRFDYRAYRHGQSKGITEITVKDNVRYPFPILYDKGLVQAVVRFQLRDKFRGDRLARRGHPADIVGQKVARMFISFKLTGNTMLGLYSPGMENAPWSMAKMIDLLQHSIIPVLVIGLMNTCSLMRTMRGQMLDELGKNYVMTARAKGMKARAIRYKYCVRAAINPIVSSIGWSLVNIFTGTTIVAIVLNLPSMGRVMHNALLDQDMYLAGSWLFLMAIMTVVGTFISDLLLAWLDPRARAEYLKG